MEEDLDNIESPKSPKTPKLSQEVHEMALKSRLNDHEKQEESVIIEIENVETEDPENNPEFEKTKELLKLIIESAPAGQVQIVSSICKDLFNNLPNFIENEGKNKMIKDGDEGNFNEIVDSTDCEEEFKMELTGKMEKYVKEFYPETGKFLIQKSKENEWKIQVLAQKIKSKAFWSGHWRSIWTVELKEGDEDEDEERKGKETLSFSIYGNVELIVHYHEEGTVQLSTKKEIPSRVNIKFDSLSEAADKIYWKIKDSEDTIQLALNEAYQQLSENIFKKLRRQLPVTRTKMDWAKFANYNLSTELKK